MFAVNSHTTYFDVFDRVIRSIVNINDDESVPITICISQIDRLKSDSTLNMQQVKGKVIEILTSYDCSDYEIFETSSKENINIETVIDRTIEKGYFFNGSEYTKRRELLEKVVKKDTKVFQSDGGCLLS